MGFKYSIVQSLWCINTTTKKKISSPIFIVTTVTTIKTNIKEEDSTGKVTK